jgi:hypothetical protein
MSDAIKKAGAEPLLVRPETARAMLGGCSAAFFWGRVLPELRSFLVGRARWIEVASIREYVARHLAEGPQRWRSPNAKGQPIRHLRGRPRKATTPPTRRRGRPRKVAAPAEAAAV